MPEIYEGVLEDLLAKHDLQGQTVRIEVVRPAPRNAEWFDKLKAWIDEFKVEGPAMDDSRDSIYTGTMDDTR